MPGSAAASASAIPRRTRTTRAPRIRPYGIGPQRTHRGGGVVDQSIGVDEVSRFSAALTDVPRVVGHDGESPSDERGAATYGFEPHRAVGQRTWEDFLAERVPNKA